MSGYDLALEGDVRVSMVAGSVSRLAGGMFYSVRQLARALQDAAMQDVEVFGAADRYTEADRGEWSGVKTSVGKTVGPGAFGYCLELPGFLERRTPDIVHIQGLWMYPSVACMRWAAQSKGKYLVSPRGMLDEWALRNSRWKKQIAAVLYENAHLRRAACLHALNEAEARSIRVYGLRNPVCVIPNGVDLPDLAASDQHVGERRCVFLGRIHPKKGIGALLKAWAKAAPRDGWKLEIAGWDQGGHEKDLRRLTEELRLQTSVRFVGPKFGAEKDAFLRGASAFLLPSLSEGLPVAVLEAWSYGLPVVMTPECNLPEGFDSGAAIRSEGDVDSLAAALSYVMAAPNQELQEMGMRGRRLVESRFAWPRIGRQMADVYSWLLNGGARPDTVQTF